MPEPAQLPLYEFRAFSWAEVKGALEKLANAEETLLKADNPVIPKIYARFRPLPALIKVLDDSNPILSIDKEMIRFLNPLIAESVIDNPEDAVMSDYLLSSLILISAAVNIFPPDDFVRYTPEELSSVVAGRGDIYEDITFARSLRSYLEDVKCEEEASILLSSLAPVKEGEELAYSYWDGAVIYSMIQQVVWKYFYSFNDNGQQFLMQNYFYHALVAGVPIRSWLKVLFDSVDNAADKKKMSAGFAKFLENSVELVPVDTENFQRVKFGEALKDYLAQAYGGGEGEDIEILKQEKFIQGVYGGQVFEEAYSGWLREALTIAMKLRKGEL